MNPIYTRTKASLLLSLSLLCFQLAATARAESIEQATVIPITLTPVVAAATSCDQQYSRPQLEYKGSEDYTVDGNTFTRHLLGITNYKEFPDDLFQASPNLPACGSNKNASRTWVDINDKTARLYGFCDLSSAQNLNSLWFAVAKGNTPPSSVQVVLNDRLCNKQYTSNTVKIALPPPADNRCDQEYPAPKLAVNGTEQFERNGKRYTRYRLKITNRSRYPDDFFTALDNVPACGNRDFASRTVADVLTSNGTVLNSFCALTAPRQLRTLRFTMRAETPPPTLVHAQLTDRLCEKTYTSNSVRVVQPDPKIEVNCDDASNPKQLENAIASAKPGSTFLLQGNCPGNFTIPSSVDNITIDGLTSDGRKTEITGTGLEDPGVVVDGAQNVTFKNMVFKRSFSGISYINGATGRLINVDATENVNGIVISGRSSVTADDITANYNNPYGVQILKQGSLTLTDLNGSKRLNLNLDPQLFPASANPLPQQETNGLALINADPLADTSDANTANDLNCSMQALSNYYRDTTVQVYSGPDGASIYVDGGSDFKPNGCQIELGNNLMAVGLHIVNGANAELTNSILNIHDSMEGIKANNASTLNIIGSRVVVQNNQGGVVADKNSTLMLNPLTATNSPPRNSLLKIIDNIEGSLLDSDSELMLAPGSSVKFIHNQLGLTNINSTVTCGTEEETEVRFRNNLECNGYGNIPTCANIMNAPAVDPFCPY